MATQDVFKRQYASKGICVVCGGIGGIHCRDSFKRRKIVSGSKIKRALRRKARHKLNQATFE